MPTEDQTLELYQRVARIESDVSHLRVKIDENHTDQCEKIDDITSMLTPIADKMQHQSGFVAGVVSVVSAIWIGLWIVLERLWANTGNSGGGG
jgi:hypothetical protein